MGKCVVCAVSIEQTLFAPRLFVRSFVCSLIWPFTCSCVRSLDRMFRSFTRSSGCSLVRSFARSHGHSLAHAFVRSFVRSLVCSAHSLVHSLVRLVVRSIVRSFVRSLARPYGHSLVHAFVRSLARMFRSFSCSFIHSFIHSFVCALARWFIRSFVRSFVRLMAQARESCLVSHASLVLELFTSTTDNQAIFRVTLLVHFVTSTHMLLALATLTDRTILQSQAPEPISNSEAKRRQAGLVHR